MMHYKITIEGGFTGIPKEYEGEITIGKNELKKLLRAFKASRFKKERLRDGQEYYIELMDGDDIFRENFDESNLPIEVRNFIDRIRDRS